MTKLLKQNLSREPPPSIIFPHPAPVRGFFYFVVAAAIFLDPSGGSSRSALWAPFLDPSGGSSRSALWAPFFSSSLFHPSGFGTEPALPSGINPIKLYSTVRYHLWMIFLQGYIWPRGFLTIYIPGRVNILYSPRFFHIIYLPSDLILRGERLFILHSLCRLIIVVQE